MSNLSKNIYYLLIFLIIFVGIFFRLDLYFFNLSLHCDEAKLALIIMDGTFIDLLKPLRQLQAAPVGFLTISKIMYNIVLLHNTAYFSDLVLRLVPLISGILAIPAFGYLLNCLFKNKIINLLGMLILAINPSAISYSCIFKQYSTELLITILILLIFVKINFTKKSYFYFAILSFMPMFSLSSYFILPAGFIYLSIKAFREKRIKEFFIGSIIFGIPFILYSSWVIYPIFSSHYVGMKDYWSSHFAKGFNFLDYLKYFIIYNARPSHPIKIFALVYLFCISTFLMIFDKNKKFILIFSPILITYIFTINRFYPMHERFLLFLFPIFVILSVYIITLIRSKHKNILIFCICIYLLYCYTNIFSTQSVVNKQEPGREIWEYLAKHYDNSSIVILSSSINTNKYYKNFYGKNMKFSDFKFSNKTYAETYKDIPKGDYYLVITKYKDVGKNFAELLLKDAKVESKNLFHCFSTLTDPIPSKGALIKFEKLN